MFQFSKKGPIRYLESKALKECNFLTHGFLTRWGGISEGPFSDLNFSLKAGDRQAHVERNFRVLSEHFEVPQWFTMSQVHGDRVLFLKGRDEIGADPPQADAVITAEPGIGIGIKTADCVPILVVDRVRKVIGAVHAGWRSTALRIGPKAVSAFVSAFSSQVHDLIAVIGPCIGPCCYEVDRVVFDQLSEADRECGLRAKSTDKWMLDLPAVNRAQLIEAGLDSRNVFSADQCTACRCDLFFSHRQEGGNTGRQLNFIMLKTDKIYLT